MTSINDENSLFSLILRSKHVSNMRMLLNLNDKFSFKDATHEDFENLQKRKTRLQLIIISLIVCGIEFCYAAETSFVSPILLKIGIPIQYMTMVWCLSPFIGFITCPILGLLSDSCNSKLGRRRPFIILYSCGIVLGLLFVSYGEYVGMALDRLLNLNRKNVIAHPFVIFITVIGVFLLDFNCDACQSPARAYLIDICLKEDHSLGLSTFTIMAGIGGFFGYIIAGIPWEDLLMNKSSEINSNSNMNDSFYNSTIINGITESNHIQIIFTCVLVIYLLCATVTLTSFKEINLNQMQTYGLNNLKSKINNYEELKEEPSNEDENRTETTSNPGSIYNIEKTTSSDFNVLKYLKQYFSSIIKIEKHLLLLCVTNCFCWMSLVCYSLYFTDFVAKEIFGGEPNPLNKKSYLIYEKGVRYGSICMAFYSLSCSIYSYLLDYLINRFEAKPVYVTSQLIYSISMLILALTKTKLSALLISPAAGMMYSTLFTMPYLLVAKYHHHRQANEKTELLDRNNDNTNELKRGLGADISLVGSMVFLAQFILSLFMGTFIKLIGSNTVIAYLASLFALCGAITANFLLYVN